MEMTFKPTPIVVFVVVIHRLDFCHPRSRCVAGCLDIRVRQVWSAGYLLSEPIHFVEILYHGFVTEVSVMLEILSAFPLEIIAGRSFEEM